MSTCITIFRVACLLIFFVFGNATSTKYLYSNYTKKHPHPQHKKSLIEDVKTMFFIKDYSEAGIRRTMFETVANLQKSCAITQNATRRGSTVAPKTVEELAKILGGTVKGEDVVVDKCSIKVTSSAKPPELILDFTKDTNCLNIMSLPKVFTKLQKETLENDKLLIPAEKFNVETVKIGLKKKSESMEINLKAKESFELIKGSKIDVQDGNYSLSYAYADKYAYKKLVIVAGGHLMIGSKKISYTITKAKDQDRGVFDAQASTVNLAEVYKAFGDDSLEKNSLALKTFNVPLLDKSFIGYVDDYSSIELYFKGNTETKGSLSFIMTKEASNPQVFGVFIKEKQNAGDFIHKLTKFDLQEVVILNDTSDMIVSFATQEVPIYHVKTAINFKNLGPALLLEGLILRINIDLMHAIRDKGYGNEKYIKQLPNKAVIRIDVKINGNELDISMPPDQEVDLAVALHSVIPGMDQDVINQMLDTPVKARINILKVSVASGNVNVNAKVSLGLFFSCLPFFTSWYGCWIACF